MLLIVGSKGLIGRYTKAYWRANGGKVICTSHGPGEDLCLDLREPVGNFTTLLPGGVTHALICSGITAIDNCCRDPETTRIFNVIHTIELLSGLLKHSITPIFCSSDLVFRGDRGYYSEEDARYPTTEYGRQKKVVEDFLLGQDDPFIIIRMSKLYSLEKDDPSPVGQIINSLLKGNAIRCADDQVVCPTCVDDISRAIKLLIDSKATGVYHLAAPKVYTRYTLGLAIAEPMGLNQLILRCSIRDFNFADPRPANNSLNVSKFLLSYGFEFSTLESNLPTILYKRSYRECGS
ncbi:MAG: sugar nucleotide-binding protein [Bacillota bacterium]